MFKQFCVNEADVSPDEIETVDDEGCSFLIWTRKLQEAHQFCREGNLLEEKAALSMFMDTAKEGSAGKYFHISLWKSEL